jgi:flagellar motor protein MotB
MQTEDTNPLETVTPTDLEQAQLPAEEVSTEPGAEQTAEPDEKLQEAPKPKTDWAQRRIDQLTREKYEERRQREALEARLREQQPQEQQQPAMPDIDKLVEQRLAQKQFDEACNRVFQAGVKESPEFEQNLRTLQSVGEIGRDFLEVVTEMDAGHKVLSHLGANPDIAERVLSLPPLKQALELARIEASLNAPKSAPPPPPVSRAPDPIKPVGSGRVAPAGLSDDLPIDEWMRRHNKR